jgi:hypothetical protein
MRSRETRLLTGAAEFTVTDLNGKTMTFGKLSGA